MNIIQKVACRYNTQHTPSYLTYMASDEVNSIPSFAGVTDL